MRKQNAKSPVFLGLVPLCPSLQALPRQVSIDNASIIYNLEGCQQNIMLRTLFVSQSMFLADCKEAFILFLQVHSFCKAPTKISHVQVCIVFITYSGFS